MMSMAEYSFIFFIGQHSDDAHCLADDPAMEIKALDLLLGSGRECILDRLKRQDTDIRFL